MKLPHKKSPTQRLLHTITETLDVVSRPSAGLRKPASGIKARLPGVGSGNALKAGLPEGKGLKAGLIAGGLAGLAAGSAGISSLRRRTEGARDDS